MSHRNGERATLIGFLRLALFITLLFSSLYQRAFAADALPKLQRYNGLIKTAGLPPRLFIGSTETVGFKLPAGGIFSAKAKVDTGAKTSSLHAEDITLFDKDGVQYVRFKTGQKGDLKVVEFPVSRTTKVKSSNGVSELRPFVNIPVTLGGVEYSAEFSLNDRSKMDYPVLLGAEFLKGRFWVDVEQQYVLSR